MLDSQQDLRPSPQKGEGEEGESQRELGRALFWAWDGYCTHAHGTHTSCTRPPGQHPDVDGEEGVIVPSDEATSEVSMLMQAVLVKPSGSQNKIQVKDDDGRGLVGEGLRETGCVGPECIIYMYEVVKKK